MYKRQSLSGCQIALQDGNLALKRLAQTGVRLVGSQFLQRFLQFLDPVSYTHLYLIRVLTEQFRNRNAVYGVLAVRVFVRLIGDVYKRQTLRRCGTR